MVNKELLSMPHVIEVTFLLGVLHSGGVSAGDEVRDAAVDTGTSMPQDFGRATIEHRRGPDSKDNVLFGESSIIDESLMLVHAIVKRDIIILAPATEGMEEENGVLVSLLEELLTGVLEKENMTIMEGVAHLEGVDGIGAPGDNFVMDLFGGLPVGVHAITKLDALDEFHGFARDIPVTLCI